MSFVYDGSCSLIPELIGECVTHKAEGYGHGIITSAYVHPKDPEKNLYIVIKFDNGYNSSYFNLGTLIAKQLISFDSQGINSIDKLTKLKRYAGLDLGKRALIFNRQNDAKKSYERVQNYLTQKATEAKAQADALEKQRLEDEKQRNAAVQGSRYLYRHRLCCGCTRNGDHL